MSEGAQGMQWVGGWHAVLAALARHPGEVEAVWLAEGRDDRRARAVVAAARAAGVRLRKVPRAALDRLAAGLAHQGVLARLRGTRVHREAELDGFLARLPAPPPLLLALDGVQDPHNLGACLRTADAAGVHAVIAPRDRTAPLSPAARRAAAGAAEWIPFFQVTNLARTLRLLQEAGLWVVGTAADAPRSLYETDLAAATTGLVLVLGGEERGLRRLTREHCDLLVRIPMAGRVAALNVSVAAGVCLFEIRRQRGLTAPLAEPAPVP